MKEYIALKEKHSNEHFKLNKQYNFISIIRLFIGVSFLVCLFFCLKTGNSTILLLVLITFLSFLFLMKIHQKITLKRRIAKTLISINEDEIAYLNNERIPFLNGIEYNDDRHPYSHDLDIFGENSLFQHVNRTSTFIGKLKLSNSMLFKLPDEGIISNQDAIKELSQKINWRQHLLALAKITNDNKGIYERLVNWSKIKETNLPSTLIWISYGSPIILIIGLLLFYFTKNSIYGYSAASLFLINILLLLTQLKRIKKEISDSDKNHETIKSYSSIIESIEKENFESSKLKSLKKQLEYKAGPVTKQIKDLSSLYADMQNILNPIAAILLNGFFLYHIHSLKALLNWKKEYSTHISTWLDVIGEFEMLNSFANFSYNNPNFTFPSLNTNEDIILHDLGHPLIKTEARIANTVKFGTHKFIILTGSNMSGKSTFLRTLGINMVLAGTGAPICSSFANIQPLEILASMRLSDSLNDSESYFFAEVKRLKQIMNRLDQTVCLILLDEILRGTNSDDKRSGTIEVIKKIISKNAIGVIATHDLEVCLTTNEYPTILMNKCFEVEILNNDLSFDYKLRDGICQNKSATFIMKKMGVI